MSNTANGLWEAIRSHFGTGGLGGVSSGGKISDPGECSNDLPPARTPPRPAFDLSATGEPRGPMVPSRLPAAEIVRRIENTEREKWWEGHQDPEEVDDPIPWRGIRDLLSLNPAARALYDELVASEEDDPSLTRCYTSLGDDPHVRNMIERHVKIVTRRPLEYQPPGSEYPPAGIRRCVLRHIAFRALIMSRRYYFTAPDKT